MDLVHTRLSRALVTGGVVVLGLLGACGNRQDSTRQVPQQQQPPYYGPGPYAQPGYPPAQPGYPPAQPGYPTGQPVPPAATPASPPPTAAWPFPFPVPSGWTLPPAPTGWAIPNLPWPFPTAIPPATTAAPPATTTPAPPGTTPPGTLPLPDAAGAELADRINAYRQSRGLPAVPRSRALGQVAQAHVRDLEMNQPDGGSCNLHSWSNRGAWTACCYTPDHAQAQCMWRKPAELTGFQAMGYEIAAKTTGTMTPADAVAMWQGSPGHHAVMINDGNWRSRSWRSIGTAVSQHFAVAWFAEEADPAGGF